MPDQMLTFTQGPLKGEKFLIKEGVTYLVGKNGSGKTQVLEAIKNGHCQIITPEGQSGINLYQAFEWNSKPYDDKRGKATEFSDLKLLMKELDQIPVEPIISKKRTEETRDEAGNKVNSYSETTTQSLHGTEFDSSMLSTGTKEILERFNWRALDGKPFPEKRNITRDRVQSYFLLWDEPENHLHPSEQKKIPKRLDEWLEINKGILAQPNGTKPKPTFIVVATHSPFILSDLHDRANHNVICLDKCRVVQTTVDKSTSEKRVVANELLGAGIQDLLPGRMILTECSIQKLISEIAKTLNHNINNFFVTANGDSNIEQRIMNLSEMTKILVQIGRSWPEKEMLKLSIFVIADDLEFKRRLDILDTGQWLTLSSHALGTKQLEDIYPLDWIHEFFKKDLNKDVVWNKKTTLFNSFLYTECKIDDKNKGETKSKLAEFIASKIKNHKDLLEFLKPVSALFELWKNETK